MPFITRNEYKRLLDNSESRAAEPVAPGASAPDESSEFCNDLLNTSLVPKKFPGYRSDDPRSIERAAPAGTQPAPAGECEHVWKAHIDSQFSNEAVTDVFCEKCNVSGGGEAI